MANLRWDVDDFRNSQDSSGATADLVSHSGELQQGYRHGSLTRGLVAYYPMEKGEGEVLLDGALANLGSFNGGSWSNSTVIGNHSYDFSGASSGAVVEDSPELRVASTKTLSGWFKSDQTDEGVLLMKGEGGNPIEFFFALDSDGTLIYGQQDSSNYDSFKTTETFNDGNWHHALVRVQNNEAEIWADGALKTSKTMQNSSETTKNMAIGSRATNLDRILQGLITEVRIYDRALSQPEIKALYNLSQTSGIYMTEKKVPSQNQGGVSRYKFNGDVTDSWSSNDGTDNTTVSPSYKKGVYGQAKNFNGNDDSIDIGDIGMPFDGSEPFTLATWINTTSSSDQTIIGIDDGYQFRINKIDGKWSIEFDIGGSPHAKAKKAVNDGKWHHCVITYTNDTFKSYIDGKAQGTGTNSSWNLTPNIIIGKRENNSQHFDGQIDDVRIYNTALTPQQVEKLYHKGAYRIPRRSTLQ